MGPAASIHGECGHGVIAGEAMHGGTATNSSPVPSCMLTHRNPERQPTNMMVKPLHFRVTGQAAIGKNASLESCDPIPCFSLSEHFLCFSSGLGALSRGEAWGDHLATPPGHQAHYRYSRGI